MGADAPEETPNTATPAQGGRAADGAYEHRRRHIMNTKRSGKKYRAAITYCIALACLLAGLFLPVYDGGMLFTALPDAFCKTFGFDGCTLGRQFTRQFVIDFGGASYDAAPLLVALYAAVTAAGAIMLIPIFASSAKKCTAKRCVYAVEATALAILSAYAFAKIIDCAKQPQDFSWDYGLTGIALGGTAAMLAVLAVADRGGSGLMKLAMLLLGAAGVLCLADLPALFGYTKAEIFGGNFYIGYYNDVAGTALLEDFFANGFDFFGPSPVKIVTGTAAAISVLLIIFNFIADIIQLCAPASKPGLVFDIIRYGAELVLLAATAIMLFVLNVQNLSPGLPTGVLLLLALVKVTVSSIRCGAFRPRMKSADIPAENAELPPPPAYVVSYSVQAPSPAPAQTGGEIVYTPREIYGGPSDDFISTLEESEKIEFGKTFLDKRGGPMPDLPDYVVGGDNADFFEAIFLHLGKYRSKISDGLMNKIYGRLNAKQP